MRSKHTQETKDKILQLWNANMSAQRIADRFGLTKNTVIAMLRTMRRHGLHVRYDKNPNRNPYKRPREPRRKKRTPPLAIAKKPLPKGFVLPNIVMKSKERWVPLLHLDDNTCRFTRDGKLFCNAPSQGSYCQEHGQIMGPGYHSVGVNLRQLVRR